VGEAGHARDGHQYRPDVEGFLAAHDSPFSVRKGTHAICANRQHRLNAIKRWFNGPGMKLDNKVKASIVEGVVVFLSLFDEQPRRVSGVLPGAIHVREPLCLRSKIWSRRGVSSACTFPSRSIPRLHAGSVSC
jgi:hypothetical protein